MDKPQVDIFIEQSVKGIRRQPGAYGFTMCVMTSAGPADRTIFGTGNNFSAHEIELVAIADALGHLTKPCDIRLHSPHGFFERIIENMWIIQWQQSGWINSKGNEVENRHLYEEILNLTECGGHEIIKIDADLADYAGWLSREVAKAAEEYKKELETNNFTE